MRRSRGSGVREARTTTHRKAAPMSSRNVISSNGKLLYDLGDQGIVNDRTIGAAGFELRSGFAQVRRVPEAGADLLALVDDLLLLHQLGEQDVERTQRHDH